MNKQEAKDILNYDIRQYIKQCEDATDEDFEALDLAIEALGGADSATTTDEVVDFNNMISAGGRIRNLPLPINAVEKPDINTTEQGRPLCNTCKYSDRLWNEYPCYDCIAGFRMYEPVTSTDSEGEGEGGNNGKRI